MPGSRSSTEAGGQKEWWKLVPWVAVISVVFMLTGLIVWGVNATNATNHSTKAIEALKGSLDTRISYVKPSLDALVVVYSIMAAILLSIALCRKRIEALTDKSGEARGAGSFCWLMVSSVLTFIWWVLCTMMVLLIMGNVVWASLVWVMNKGVGATLTSLEALQAAILANGTNVTLPVAPTNGTCPAGCLDLTFLDDLIGGYPCVCAQQRLRDAKKETSSALTCLTAMIIGSWFMYVGSSWLLMNSVSDFAITRRERKLLRKQIQVNVKYYPDEAFERSAETERARFMAEAEREKARYEVERARYLADAERMRAMYIDRADGAERGGSAYGHGLPPGPMAPPGANGPYDPRGGASASRSFANLNDAHAVEGQRFLPGGPSSTR